MRSIAFFRDLNQGQRGSPSTSELVAAFRAAGAERITPVGANGTILFSATEPGAVGERVAARLLPWRDQVFIRDLPWLEKVLVTVDGDLDSVTEVTIYEGEAELVVALPHPAKGCTITQIGAGFAVVVNDGERRSNGTPAIERIVGRPATSRSVATLRRVFAAGHGDGPPPGG